MAGSAPILLVDDDESLRRVVEYQLEEAGYRVTACASAEEALEAVAGDEYRLVITDLVMPGIGGMDLLDRLRVLRPDAGVVVITAHGDVASAVRAMQLGALDYLEKPFSGERLRVAVERACELVDLRDENRRLRAIVQDHGGFESILGSSEALQRVLADLRLAADSEATVLIAGESGTGKELAARAIHLNSRRRDGPFVVVNCGAIPNDLVESELFGHRKGAFTGAVGDHEGKFVAANGGTIFLDEVGELPSAAQPRLLRVLQEGEVDTVGAPRPVEVDVRVIAASNRDLEALVSSGQFREDLYYRLDVVPLRMPPLRERREDVPILAEHFLLEHSRRHERPLPQLEADAVDCLERYDWPGNVRELSNVIERLVVLARTDTIGVGDLPAHVRSEHPSFGGARVEIPPGGVVLDELERGLIEEALERCEGNQSAAARFLGISRQTLVYRMKKFGLR